MICGELWSMGCAVRVWSRPGLGKDWLECAGWDRMAKRCPCEHAWVHGCVCALLCVCVFLHMHVRGRTRMHVCAASGNAEVVVAGSEIAEISPWGLWMGGVSTARPARRRTRNMKPRWPLFKKPFQGLQKSCVQFSAPVWRPRYIAKYKQVS